MSALLRDPRHFQITVLGSLLLWGVLGLDLEVRGPVAATILAVALLTQVVATWWLGRRGVDLRFDPRSPLISALSLTLLLRTTSPWVAAFAALVTIGGKFVIRVRGKHVFNPTNLGLVAALLFTGGAWVSPGQWGSAAVAAFAVACLGFVVVRRAERSDVTWAFLLFYGGVVFGRAWWLGDPLPIPLHHLSNGAFLIFAFFMISDPKTTPDSRPGRVLFALLVALGAGFVQFHLFRPNGLIWALAAAAPLVPFIDRWLPGGSYHWPRRRRPALHRDPALDNPALNPNPTANLGLTLSPKEPAMQRSSSHRDPRPRPADLPARSGAASALSVAPFLALLLGLLAAPTAAAFCGFYVAKADTDLFNQASKVVLVRDGDRTVVTMANDYRGAAQEFALVVPVPTFLEREQIHVGNRAVLDHLDAYTAPRLVEYYDENPCRRYELQRMADAASSPPMVAEEARAGAKSLGVTIEASYTVGEYDILILSAEESRGLETWLTANGYRVPDGAGGVLASYIKQGMRFFVAKVNLAERERLGFNFLRPLQVAYETPKFMLPIRLGTVNADGPQELFVFALTRTGRVETTNYRTVKLPTDAEVPLFVGEEFADFYRAMFRRQVEEHDMRAVFLEYAWDMAWCDPCAADPLSAGELQELGVFWLAGGGGGPVPRPTPRSIRPAPGGGPQDVFVTRLHLRYDGAHFPQDLRFQETGDRSNFQGRYILRHPWTGDDQCPAADAYRQELAERHATQAERLAEMTGWEVGEIRNRMGLTGTPPAPEPWWKRLWPGE